MPPCAASNAPARAATAPVNAPRAWPNSSPSISELASAAQSTITNGPAARADASWIARADQLLARARLAQDQHRRVALRDARHLREQLAHRRAGADQPAEALASATARPATPPPDSAARTSVPPTRMRAPSGTSARPTCRFSTKVPLRLPRSRTQVPRSVGSSSACRRDTSRSAMRTWAPGADPSVVRPRDHALVRAGLVGPAQLGPAARRRARLLATQLGLVVVLAGGHRGSLYRIPDISGPAREAISISLTETRRSDSWQPASASSSRAARRRSCPACAARCSGCRSRAPSRTRRAPR